MILAGEPRLTWPKTQLLARLSRPGVGDSETVRTFRGGEINLWQKSVCSKSCRNDCRDLQRFYFNLFSLVLEIVLVRLVRRDGAVCRFV